MAGEQNLIMNEEHGFNMNEEQAPDMMNLNMSEDEMQRVEDDEAENKSSDEENDVNAKRRRYNRHTPEQIQALEVFFMECPHPDNFQRNELSQELGLEPLQVKFWFQNKRTQMKTKHERHENRHLRAENERLRAENSKIKEALSNICCRHCGRLANISDHLSVEERQLRIENARLHVEIEQIQRLAANYVGKPITNSNDAPSSSAAIPHLTGGATHDYQGNPGNDGYQGAPSGSGGYQGAPSNAGY